MRGSGLDRCCCLFSFSSAGNLHSLPGDQADDRAKTEGVESLKPIEYALLIWRWLRPIGGDDPISHKGANRDREDDLYNEPKVVVDGDQFAPLGCGIPSSNPRQNSRKRFRISFGNRHLNIRRPMGRKEHRRDGSRRVCCKPARRADNGRSLSRLPNIAAWAKDVGSQALVWALARLMSVKPGRACTFDHETTLTEVAAKSSFAPASRRHHRTTV
jgi:hypothetical protein